MEAEKMFPPGTLDTETAEAYYSRAARLEPIPRSAVRLVDSSEWFCRGFFFGEQADDDLVISISGIKGVVAAEIKFFPEAASPVPERQTKRLSPEEGTVFRDMLERHAPWLLECDIDLEGHPLAILEFIKPETYTVLVLEDARPGCSEHEIAAALVRLWPEHSSEALRRLGEQR